MGGITEIATSAPGYNSLRPNSAAPLAEILKLNGYSTAQFGKCHEVPVWETSPMGPFDRWPAGGGGFEHFYGFIGGETNQYAPAIYNGTVPVESDRTPEEGYHFTEDIADRAIEWIRQQKALMSDKPFFVYFAPGATHAPHHVPVEWSAKYRGAFDDGWDALRERTFARQKDLGVIPPDAELTARPAEIPAWDDMPDDLKPVLARQMEVFAGFLEHTDHHVGRVVDALADLGVLEDTLILYVIGDNGASAEGQIHGTFNELMSLNGAAALETTEFMVSNIDRFGTPEAYNHYAVGWAHAMDTPPVDEAGCLPLGRDPQRHDHPRAEWVRGAGGDAPAVQPRDRRGGHDPGRRRPAPSNVRERGPADAAARRQHGADLRRRGRARVPGDPVLRDVRQPRHLPQGLDRGHPAQHPVGDRRDAGPR
jgi:arylsulfatase